MVTRLRVGQMCIAAVFGATLPALSAGEIKAPDPNPTASQAEPTLVGDIAAGEKLYRRNCRACHGANAKGASSYPRLTGHPAAYLIDKLERYRAGEIFGPNTPLMAQRVKKLTDQDFTNVTAYILSLTDS